MGRNIAENLVRLGLAAELVTVLGDDRDSEELAASCMSLGIGLRGTLRLPGARASRYLCLLDAGGRLVGAVSDMAAFSALDPTRLAERSALLDGASLIVVDANLPSESIGWLVKRYGRRSRPRGRDGPALVLDPVSTAKASRAAPWIGGFDLAKPNRAEAAILAGLDPSAIATDHAVIGDRLRGLGLGEAYISLGPEGMYVHAPSWRGIARPPADPPPGLEPKNLSGAGDAALAALAWGSLRGQDCPGRAASAVAAALIAAASPRTVNPDLSVDLVLDVAKGVILESLS